MFPIFLTRNIHFKKKFDWFLLHKIIAYNIFYLYLNSKHRKSRFDEFDFTVV